MNVAELELRAKCLRDLHFLMATVCRFVDMPSRLCDTGAFDERPSLGDIWSQGRRVDKTRQECRSAARKYFPNLRGQPGALSPTSGLTSEVASKPPGIPGASFGAPALPPGSTRCVSIVVGLGRLKYKV